MLKCISLYFYGGNKLKIVLSYILNNNNIYKLPLFKLPFIVYINYISDEVFLNGN